MKGYVEYRLKVAGMEDSLFTDGAIKRLYKCSAGIPRVINSLATSALLEGFGKGFRIIDESLINDAARELGLNGYREN
jgi:type II secretory pathway predicted ATPase ExeA